MSALDASKPSLLCLVSIFLISNAKYLGNIFLSDSTDLMNYVTRSTGIGGAYAKDGLLFAPDSPGLGVKPDFESLDDPVAQWRL